MAYLMTTQSVPDAVKKDQGTDPCVLKQDSDICASLTINFNRCRFPLKRLTRQMVDKKWILWTLQM